MTLLQRVICHATDLYVGKMADGGIEMDGWTFLALGLEPKDEFLKEVVFEIASN